MHAPTGEIWGRHHQLSFQHHLAFSRKSAREEEKWVETMNHPSVLFGAAHSCCFTSLERKEISHNFHPTILLPFLRTADKAERGIVSSRLEGPPFVRRRRTLPRCSTRQGLSFFASSSSMREHARRAKPRRGRQSSWLGDIHQRMHETKDTGGREAMQESRALYERYLH